MTGRINPILVDGVSEDYLATTGHLDQWELERIAKLEGQEQHDKAVESASASPLH